MAEPAAPAAQPAVGLNSVIKPLQEAPPPGPASVDRLFDGMGDDMAELLSPEKKPKQPKQAAAPEPQNLPREPESDDGEETIELPGEEAPEEKPEPTPDTFGTAEDPYTVHDLGEDKFIRVKVDGEEKVISLREAVEGGIRQETFSKRVALAQQETERAKRIAESFKERIQGLGQNVRELFSSPEKHFDYMMENYPDQLKQVAEAYAQFHVRSKQDPDFKLQYLQQKYEARMAKQREFFENKQRNEELTQQQQAARADAERRLRPGFEAGMKEAGFPKRTAEFNRMTMLALQTRAQETGQPVTADDVRNAVVRVAKFLQLEKGAEQKPRPVTVQRAPRPEQPSPQQQANGRKRAPSFQTNSERAADALLRGAGIR